MLGAGYGMKIVQTIICQEESGPLVNDLMNQISTKLHLPNKSFFFFFSCRYPSLRLLLHFQFHIA